MGKKAWNINDRRLSGKTRCSMFIGAVVIILIGVGMFNSSSDIVIKIIGAVFVLGGIVAIFGR